MMTNSILAVMKRIIAVALLGTFMTFATTSMVLIPAEPAHAGIVSDVLDGIKSRVRDVVKPLTDAIKSIVNAIKVVVNAIKVVVNAIKSVVDTIRGILSNFITFNVGLNPNNVVSFVVTNHNEDACQNLPEIVNHLGDNLPPFPDLPFISHLLPFDPSDLQPNIPDLVGIDPSSASSEDLFRFKTLTHLPLTTLGMMAKYPYKIPTKIAAAFSTFCVDATKHYLAMKKDEKKMQDEEDRLHNDIRQDLALGGLDGRHAVNSINQLPAAQGGLLEEVRFVVSETIRLFEEAGESLDKETHLQFAEGDAALADGRFREAYERYQRAYSAATTI